MSEPHTIYPESVLAAGIVTGASGSLSVVIDASVWVRMLRPQDPNHQAARSWISTYLSSGGILIAPALFAVEVVASISRNTGNPADARLAARQLYTGPMTARMNLVVMDQTIIAEAINMAADFGVRGADATYVALAKQLGIPLVSFDHEQLTRPARAITTIHP